MDSVISAPDVLNVHCPFCKSLNTYPCRTTPNNGSPDMPVIVGNPMASFHRERIKAAIAKKQGRFFADFLTPTDKAFIAYYMSVQMGASIAANSEKLLGKVMTYDQIIRFFAHSAIEELKRDGLLKYDQMLIQ